MGHKESNQKQHLLTLLMVVYFLNLCPAETIMEALHFHFCFPVSSIEYFNRMSCA